MPRLGFEKLTFYSRTLYLYTKFADRCFLVPKKGQTIAIPAMGIAVILLLAGPGSFENSPIAILQFQGIEACVADENCSAGLACCENECVSPACATDSGCDDQNPGTIDVCNNEGSCESICTNLAVEPGCEIECRQDEDCDDGIEETVDICNEDGSCDSYCTNILQQEPVIEVPTPLEPKQVQPNFSIKGLSNEKIGYGLKVIDNKGLVVGSKKPEAEEQAVPGGTYTVELDIGAEQVKKITLKKAVIDNNGNVLELQLLSSTKTGKGIEVKKPFLFNPLSEFETGEMQLSPPAGTNAVLKCRDWDSTTEICNEEWQAIKTFTGSGPITINISPEDPVFGFAEITIINVQSYPSVGGEWEARFTTVGKADLTIKAVDGTTWSNENEDKQLKFLEVKCSETVLPYKWIDDSVVVQGYECDETGSETSKVLMAGKHTLEFGFGEDIEYAYNQTDVNLSPLGAANTDGDAGVLALIDTDDTSYSDDSANSADNWTRAQTFDVSGLSGTINSITAYVLHYEVNEGLSPTMDIKCCPSGTLDCTNLESYTDIGDAAVSASMAQDSAAVLSNCADTWAEIGEMWLSLQYTDNGGKPSNIHVDYIWLTINYEEVLADLTFAMFYPASGCTQGKGSWPENASGTCDKCFFENTGLYDENQVACQGQIDEAGGPSFFFFDNQSSTSNDLDWEIDLNAALPSTLKLKMSQANDGWQAICTAGAAPSSGCVDVNNDSKALIGNSIAVATDLNAWAWADFIGVSAGSVDRNTTHYSSES